jgi:hypothetical protein
MDSSGDSMAQALTWVSRIMAVGLEMVLPGLAGQWLDARFGTGFLGPLGFVFGLIAGLWHLIVMTRPPNRPKRPGLENTSS